MPAALLAVAVLAVTVDPRLAEPLRLLAEVRDRDGQAIGERYARRPEVFALTLRVDDLPIAAANYEPRRRTVTVGTASLAEDPRVVAGALAHEMQHAADFDLVALGLLPLDCVELEARGFEAGVIVTRGLWPDEFPDGTDGENALAINVRAHEADGMDGLRDVVRGIPGYRETCAAT